MTLNPSAILQPALDVVKKSGDIVCENNQKPRHIEHKGRIDLLTDTDLAVEKYLKYHLKEVCLEADFLSEEASPDQPLGAATWVIDPVDGTTNFAHGLPLVATSVALWKENRVVLGIINLPLLGECFWAVEGKGAFCNSRQIQASCSEKMDESLVATGFSYNIAQEADIVSARLARVLARARGVRRCGAAALDLAYLAAGRFDAFYENALKPWDVAAGWLLLKEAGGILTRFDGQEYTLGAPDLLAAGSKKLHEKMQQLLAG